jgi:c-di-GMP-binding flagellar brake protein YcgR
MHSAFRKGEPRPSEVIVPMEAGAKPHHMDDPYDIGEALALLAEQGDAVTIYPAGADEPILARIYSVDDERPHFVLQLNAGSVLPPGQAVFVSWQRSAKLQFTINDQWVPLDGQPTLIPTYFPQDALVLERRHSARLETPLGVYYTAAFVLDGRPYELQLYDFSEGGVGMRAPKRDAMGLYVGRKLSRVRLELGVNAFIVADLEVRLSRSFRSFLLGDQTQVGCRFVDPTPEMQGELARLLAKLEAGRKSKV